MSPGYYTEDTLVQQTTAEYLERQLSWQSGIRDGIRDRQRCPGSLHGPHRAGRGPRSKTRRAVTARSFPATLSPHGVSRIRPA